MSTAQITLPARNWSAEIQEIAIRSAGYRSVLPEHWDTVREAVEAAGGDWGERIDGIMEGVTARDEDACQELLRLADACKLGERMRSVQSVIKEVMREEVARMFPDLAGQPDERAGEVITTRNLREIQTRSIDWRAESADTEARTVEAILASETPVPMFDYQRREIVPEILRADGARFPAQVPLLDSHNRRSIKDQLGSVRAIGVDGDAIVGRLHFASTEHARQAFEMVVEGHATDVSAGYAVLERVYVPAGRSAIVGGRSYEGPVNVATRWELKEVSAVPIGADEAAKMRGE